MNNRSRGVALVIVLSFLVLISALIVAFFSSISTEYSSAKSYSDGVTARQLADTAVNIVMGQVQEAASQPNAAWASQAGMIRTYGENGEVSERVNAFYKLYSSDFMTLSGAEVSGKGFDPDRDIPSNWYDKPALAVDLNAPIKLVNQDPTASKKYLYRFPIMDPSYSLTAVKMEGGGTGNVIDGFDIEEDSNDERQLSSDPIENKILKLGRMPVRWLYVLKDGTVTAPNREGANNSVKWTDELAKNKIPTKENPIVGRIAFWADDETNKININTAGGFSTLETYGYDDSKFPGSYWDTPRTNAQFDRGEVDSATGAIKPGKTGLALSQPVNGEFQRYPGHPSTTSLGVVFKDFLTSEQIYKLTPRIFGGDNASSMGGTNRIVVNASGSPVLSDGSPIPRKDERLYSSVDELLFAERKDVKNDPKSPDYRYADSDGNRFTNDNINSVTKVVTPDLLEKTRFFLTANSRSSELNLYGRPKLTIWPMHVEEKFRNAADRLIAFCSTIGKDTAGDPGYFIFQRSEPYTGDGDVRIARNRVLLQYLKDMTVRPIPGFSKEVRDTFVTKYDIQERNQILTEIFDYVRTVNLRDTTKNPALVTAADLARQKFAPAGIVVPSRINADGKLSQGFGRFPTISEAALVLYHAGYVGTDGQNYDSLDAIRKPNPGSVARMVPTPVGVTVAGTRVRAFLVFKFFNPMQGYAPTGDLPSGYSFDIKVTGLNGFKIEDQPMGFPSEATLKMFKGSGSMWAGRNFGGSEGTAHSFYDTRGPSNLYGAGNLNKLLVGEAGTGIPIGQFYPFQTDIGSTINVPLTPKPDPTQPVLLYVNDGSRPMQTIKLAGTTIRVQITFRPPAGKTPTSFSPFDLEFPSTYVPLPTDAVWLSDANQAAPKPHPGGMMRWPVGDPAYPTVQGTGDAWDWGSMQVNRTAVRSLAGRILWSYWGTAAKQNQDSTNYRGSKTNPGPDWTNRFKQVFQPGDTVRSVVYNGDLRMRALGDDAGFIPHPDYKNQDIRQAQSLRMSDGQVYYSGSFCEPWHQGQTVPSTLTFGSLSTNFGNLVRQDSRGGKVNRYPGFQATDLPALNDLTKSFNNGVNNSDGLPGDFDTGLSYYGDGAFAGKADEGNMAMKYKDSVTLKDVFVIPYYSWLYGETGDTFFTPNRQVPSAVSFGSLSAGANPLKAKWRTLAFSPNPAAGVSHQGNAIEPKDHLLLDLFNMPIVEPYAISEPFSTAGKVNMNYKIAPFGHIHRSTAMHAVLHGVRVPAIPLRVGSASSKPECEIYKSDPPTDRIYRRPLDREATIAALDEYFEKYNAGEPEKGFFKSPSQICEQYLYPKLDGTMDTALGLAKLTQRSEVQKYWGTKQMTGDNLREEPYADLYPRLTTKSNTYTVHMYVQTLKKRPLTIGGKEAEHYAEWVEGKDQVTSEYRGSSIIERYLNPQDRRFDPSDPETVKNKDLIKFDPSNRWENSDSLEMGYHFRVLTVKRFQP